MQPPVGESEYTQTTAPVATKAPPQSTAATSDAVPEETMQSVAPSTVVSPSDAIACAAEPSRSTESAPPPRKERFVQVLRANAAGGEAVPSGKEDVERESVRSSVEEDAGRIVRGRIGGDGCVVEPEGPPVVPLDDGRRPLLQVEPEDVALPSVGGRGNRIGAADGQERIVRGGAEGEEGADENRQSFLHGWSCAGVAGFAESSGGASPSEGFLARGFLT